MKPILAIAWKNLLLQFASRSELLFFLVLPVVFTLVIGFSSGVFEGESDSRIRLLLVDLDGGELAHDLTAALQKSQTVRTDILPIEEAERQFRDNQAPALLIIPAGLEAAHPAGQTAELEFHAAAGNPDSIAAEQALQAAIGAIGQSHLAAGIAASEAEAVHPFADADERTTFFAAAKAKAQELFMDRPVRMALTHPVIPETSETFWNPAAQASAGQLITWVFIPLLGISEFFARERVLGTLSRLISTPVSKAQFLLGTISAQFSSAFAQMLILATFGAILMGLGWWREIPATLVMFLAFGLASVAFGTMLGTFTRTAGQANGISIALGMTMALLGGCWYPRELFPDFIQQLSLALPTTWAMIGMNDIILRGQGLAEVLPEAGALLGFAALFFVAGLLRFRYE